MKIIPRLKMAWHWYSHRVDSHIMQSSARSGHTLSPEQENRIMSEMREREIKMEDLRNEINETD